MQCNVGFRWGRLRATMMPWPGLLEPITESICLGIIGGLCAYQILGLNPLLFFIVHMLIWFSMDLLFIRVVEVSLCMCVCVH